MRPVRTLVLGGGPSGLAVAYGLQGDTLLLEAEASVGGLCRSVERGGAVFDIGGHSFHTPHSLVRDLVEQLVPGGLHFQRREACVYTHGTLIPYPFQESFDQIPDPQVVRACTEGLQNAVGDVAAARNLEDYLLRRFGQGIAENFLLPYNRKLWGRDLRKVSCEWAAERVASPREAGVRADRAGRGRRPLQADTQVGYPRRGGFGGIWSSFVPHLPGVELGKRVVHIDTDGRVVVTKDGNRYGWSHLVSTIPLPALVYMLKEAPTEIKQAVERLEWVSLRVEMLLTEKPLETPIQRIYVADRDVPPHKIGLNSNSSPQLRAQPHHAIVAEVSLAPAKQVDTVEIAPRTIDLLRRVGVLRSPADIIWRGHTDVDYAYPVHTHGHREVVSSVKDWLAERDIYSLGRFGDWEYINSDECMLRGLRLAENLRRRFSPFDAGSSAPGHAP